MYQTRKSAILAGAAALCLPRAIAGVHADVNDPGTILASLTKAFEEFKAEQTKALSGKADVVTAEKVERIDASIDRFQAALDAINARLAAGEAGAGREPQSPEDRKYATDFRKWFASGDDEREVRAAQRTGIRAALTEGSPANGGYTVPVEWDRTIVDRLKLVSPMRQIAQVQNTSKRGWVKLLNDRNIGSGWVGETAARPETTTPALTPLTFAIGEIYANPSASQDLLDDSEIDIETWLAGEVELEFSRQEGIAFISGNGTNKPQGLLTYTDNTIHPWGPIATVASGQAAALASDGIIDLMNDLPSAYVPDARFIANRKTTGKIRKFKDGQGNYLWQPSYALGQPQTIGGYPVTEMPDMPDVAANAIPIMFGDFRRGYLVIDRMGIRVLRDPYTNKPYVMFYTTKRVGGGVQNPDALRYHKVSAT